MDGYLVCHVPRGMDCFSLVATYGHSFSCRKCVQLAAEVRNMQVAP